MCNFLALHGFHKVSRAAGPKRHVTSLHSALAEFWRTTTSKQPESITDAPTIGGGVLGVTPGVLIGASPPVDGAGFWT